MGSYSNYKFIICIYFKNGFVEDITLQSYI